MDEATPSKPAPLRDDLMNAVATIAKAMFPGVPVVPVMEHRRDGWTVPPPRRDPDLRRPGLFDDIDDVRAHGRDERVGIKQFYEDQEFQYRLITALSK